MQSLGDCNKNVNNVYNSMVESSINFILLVCYRNVTYHSLMNAEQVKMRTKLNGKI